MPIAAERVAAILLAGGRAERFGGDKLSHPFRGRPLAAHAAAMLSEMPFARRIAVVGPTRFNFAALGLEVVVPPPGAPLSGSLRTGVAAAAAPGCEACLVALADMPLVPEAHIAALLAAHDGGLTATLAGGRRMVPAVIGRSRFSDVAALTGDEGARTLLRGADGVAALPEWLADIDTPEDVAADQAR